MILVNLGHKATIVKAKSVRDAQYECVYRQQSGLKPFDLIIFDRDEDVSDHSFRK